MDERQDYALPHAPRHFGVCVCLCVCVCVRVCRKPYTLNPKPYTLNPKPYTLNPKPQTRHELTMAAPKALETLNPVPEPYTLICLSPKP